MYGNTPFGEESRAVELTPEQRQALRRDLDDVVAHTRELLPSDFTVGSEISRGVTGPRATIAVQPPRGAMVSADYTLEGDDEVGIDDDQRLDLAHGIAASAALQVKQATGDSDAPTAQ